jgi:predicted ArsR family transcriptional regulator
VGEHLAYDDSDERQRERMTPVSRQQRREILNAIRIAVNPKGEAKDGLTAPELAERTRFPVSTVRRRLGELQEESQVRPLADSRSGPNGKPETVWSTT